MQEKPLASQQDINYLLDFEKGSVAPRYFHHIDHLRLAYVYLCEYGFSQAHKKMRVSLQQFLKLHGIDANQYHETLTKSWLMAVEYFMSLYPMAVSFDHFLSIDNRLLDKNIMLTHYQKETLFSQTARHVFVSPDLQPIPIV